MKLTKSNFFYPLYVMLFVLQAAVIPAFSENSIAAKYTITSLTIDNGLPANFIDDIYKDSRGFIWVATQGGGLCRYDGYEFLNFSVNSIFLHLKSNFIRKVCEDKYSRLWVASDFGLDIIDLKTMQQAKLNFHTGSLDALRKNPCFDLLKDHEGNIWVLSTSTVRKISFDEKGNVRNVAQPISGKKNAKELYTAIGEMQGRVIVGKNGQVVKMTETTDGRLSASPVSNKLKFGNNLYISAFLADKDILWIGSENGLFKYDQKTDQLDRYVYEAGNANSISQNMITALEMTNDGTLVVATLKGFDFLNPKTGYIERISHSLNESELNSDFVNCLLIEGKNLWVGTEAGGINKFSQMRLNLRNYSHNNSPSSLSPNPVNSIFEDHIGNLWVGTVEGGLNLKQKGENEFIHIKAGKGSITHNSVSALEEDRNGNLWIGTWGGGVSTLNLNKLPERVFSYLPDSIDYVAILKYDKVNHGVWIGTNRHIYFFDILTNSIKVPLSNKLTQNLMGTLGCLIDRQNNLWLGTSNGLILANLNMFHKKTFKCPARFLHVPSKELNQLFLKNITGIIQSKDNSIWICSNGYGLCQLRQENGQYHCRQFSTADGLINNSCMSLLEDNKGLIWISTGNGLSSLNPHTGQFINYSKNDGLCNQQFYWNASCKSQISNRIYFGSLTGLTEIDNSTKTGRNINRKVVFTKLQVLNRTVNSSLESFSKEDISYAKEIRLHESDKSFVIEFSSMDYDNPSTVNYSYRLLGFDNKWINVSSDRRFVTYTNLDPGTYHLQVRCSNISGEWSNDVAELQIVIRPYFYKTFWFISLMVIVAIGCIVQFFRWRTSVLKRQKMILHRKVEERTRELAQQTILLETQADELKLQNLRLSEQNDEILQQRKQLIVMSEKVQEALNDRISFFTNITHEFRTPITLIIGPIERALKLSSNPKVIQQLQFVSRNSRNLLSLVNQLMDFRKVESDTIRIEPKVGNLVEFLDQTLLPFDSFASERGITLKRFYRLRSELASFDAEALRKLITNLLSNAIKFSPENDSLSIYVAAVRSKTTDECRLYICVKDNGVGINEDEMQAIFDRFYQSKGHNKLSIYGQSGTGIGLYLCRRITELMGGQIYAKNNRRQGASFRILVPLECNGLSEEERKEPTESEAFVGTAPIHITEKIAILLVEDNLDMRQYLKSVLSETYSIYEAENGQQALHILRAQHIDFVISDLMMPVMDGLELSKRVKSDLSISHIPFLMLTAKTGKQTQISSYRMGVDAILFKPFDEEVLLARIQNILETRRNYQVQFNLSMDIEKLNIEKESGDEKFVKNVMKAIQENYTNPDYDASDFIQTMGMSKTLIHNKMHTLIGQSPGNFIRDFRLNKAREILINEKNEMSISEVAYLVGFNDPKYFTRCFTKHYGVAPSMLSKEKGKE